MQSFFKSTLTSMEEFLIFLGAVIVAVPELLRRRRWREFFYYFDLCGTQSLLIVLLICFLMGVVLGIQGAIQMSKVGMADEEL